VIVCRFNNWKFFKAENILITQVGSDFAHLVEGVEGKLQICKHQKIFVVRVNNQTINRLEKKSVNHTQMLFSRNTAYKGNCLHILGFTAGIGVREYFKSEGVGEGCLQSLKSIQGMCA
jgi:hypothetical protein